MASYYSATVLEFDGCMSDGITYQEAFENIQREFDKRKKVRRASPQLRE
jgi:predicted RNase H-like HicB family nuclease